MLNNILLNLGPIENLLKFATAVLSLYAIISKLSENKNPSSAGPACSSSRARIARVWTLLSISGLFVLFLTAVFLLTWRPSRSGIGALAERAEPDVFYKVPGPSENDGYDIARGFPDRDRLVPATLIANEWSGTQRSLDFKAIVGGLLVQQYTTIEYLLKKDVDIRIILLNPDNEEEQFVAMMHRSGGSVELAKSGIRATIEHLKDLVQRCPPQSPEFPGSLQVRLISAPIFYSSWIRDRGQKNQLAHISPIFYKQEGGGPAFRLGRAYGGATLSAISDDFEEAWKMSVGTPGLPD